MIQCSKCGFKFVKENITKINKIPYCLDCGKIRRNYIAKLRRRGVNQVMKDMGLTKVRGALGGIYYE